jgi:hypothetical protein
MTRWRVFICIALFATAGLVSVAAGAAGSLFSRQKKSPQARPIHYENEIKPLLDTYCYNCHGERKRGDLDLRQFADAQLAAKERLVFEKVLRNLQTHEMPPEGRPQPTLAERELISGWINQQFFTCDCDHPDPGRVTIRRLNRAEYNNTIRDLVGVDFRPADDFPADDSGYGFDNIGDVLSLLPVLLEKYLLAAEGIVEAAMKNPETRKRLFIREPLPDAEREGAREIIASFATRAFRRPATVEETGRLLKLFESARASGESFENGIRMAAQAILISPHFLFRGELQPNPDNPAAVHPVDDYALASRLSYFLWSTMPDEELFRHAERGTLRRNLEAQVKRMLKDPKAKAFSENFAGQWLQLRNLKLVAPDPKQFPNFDDELREAMQQETELFFEHVLREDRSVMEFIDADYTFLNERLARLYGIDGVKGEQFRRVALKRSARGGLLTQASVLTITSNPTRTSPVKRGKWVLENILGTPPPPPPPNVPELEESHEAELTGTLRQRMEQHRDNPNCASCHARMDPIGFGFENFDAIGAWRTKDGEFAIDASGKLTSGEAFDGPAEFKAILLKQKRDEYVRCLAEKVLTYALGRGLEYYDKCAVDQIAKNVARNRYKFSALVLEVTKSTPFQKRRGEGERSAQGGE